MPQALTLDGPSLAEKAQNYLLEAWVERAKEPVEETERRRRAVDQIQKTCKDWVRYVLVTECNLPASEDYGGRIFTTGSYRHNVHSSGSDIDMVLIAPAKITRQHFFRTLADRLRGLRGVTDLTCAEEAIVPLISFKCEGVDIDLALVAVQMERVPDTINMLDDKIHIGLDQFAVRSVNGVRDAELLISLVPNTLVFRQALRFIKKWGKVRGIYGAKLGHISGIGFAIMVAKVCQCYPEQNGAGVVQRFFKFYRSWITATPTPSRPNQPVYITESLTPKEVLPGVPKAWSARTNAQDAQAVLPIITPAYPFQNSCYSVSRTTLATICDEINRGYETLAAHLEADAESAPTMAEKQVSQLPNAAAVPKPPASLTRVALPSWADEFPFGCWSRVLQEYNPFASHEYFLHVAVSCTNWRDYDAWVDFVEAKLRFLWTEGPINRGAAFECYPQVKVRVVTRRYETPEQTEALNRLKAAAKAEAARRAAIGGAATTTASARPSAGPNDEASARLSGLAASPGGRLSITSPQKTGLAAAAGPATPSVFTGHFFFGLDSTPNAKDARGQPAKAPDLKEIGKAWYGYLRDKMSATTELPALRIVKRKDLPEWLPGIEAAKAATAAAAAAASGSAPAATDAPPSAAAAPPETPKRQRIGGEDADAQAKPSQPAPTGATAAAPAANGNGNGGAAPPKPDPAATADADADELLGLDF